MIILALNECGETKINISSFSCYIILNETVHYIFVTNKRRELKLNSPFNTIKIK